MNDYYYEFKIGFNAWYMVLPLILILVAFLGTKRYYLEPKTMKIRRRGNKLSILNFVVVVISDLAITALIMLESGNGLIQLATNLLARDDSVVWALIIAAVVLIVAVPYIVFVMLAVAIRVGECYQLGYLTEKRRDINKVVAN